VKDDKNESVDKIPQPPPRAPFTSREFYWLDMSQYADLRDIAEFSLLGEAHFKQRHQEQIARVPEKDRGVEAIFAPPHQMHIHWAVIILVCIRLEETVKGVSTLLHKNDALPKTIQNYRDGSLIEKFREFLVESAGWSVDVPEKSAWEDVFGVYAIRNCLIHYQASFGDYAAANEKRAIEIQTFSDRHGTPGIIETWLDIDLNTSQACIDAVTKFFDELFAVLKKRSDYLDSDRLILGEEL
jgi:hypothetical protein